MNKYRYETVNIHNGRVQSRHYEHHPDDDSAVAALGDVYLNDHESVRVCRTDEDEPFASRERVDTRDDIDRNTAWYRTPFGGAR